MLSGPPQQALQAQTPPGAAEPPAGAAHGGGGGVFTIGIAQEDRPRGWRAHRHCTNGRAVSPITCWVALAPKAEWAGGRRLLLRSIGKLRAAAHDKKLLWTGPSALREKQLHWTERFGRFFFRLD